MKLTSYLTLVLTLTTAPLAIHAADPTPAAVETAKVHNPAPFRGTVSAVDAAAGTFSIASKDNTKVRVFSVAKATKLTKEEKDVTLADVKIGDYARGISTKTAPDKYDVGTAKFGPKTAEEIAADKEKKEKKEAAKAGN